jgi:acylphosphatase
VSEQKLARRFYVSGRVQGVGYRFFACHAAEQQGVTGYARNLRDGRVEVYAIGSDAQLRTPNCCRNLRRISRLTRIDRRLKTDPQQRRPGRERTG